MAKRARARRERSADAGERPGNGGKNGSAAAQPSAAAEWIKSLLVALVIFIVLRSFVVQTFVITSGSMEDTLLVGDFLVVNRAAIGSRIPLTNLRIPGYSSARRGETLIFDPRHEPDMMLVKRLVGMPGDTVAMRGRVLYMNGEPVDEPYVKRGAQEDETHPWMAWQAGYLAPGVDPSTYRPTRDNWGPLVIPEDHYFLLGDNREASLDSRYWGLIEGWRLEGRVSLIYFSYNRGSLRPFAFLREIRWGRIGNLVR